jgi:hypothetical protein
MINLNEIFSLFLFLQPSKGTTHMNELRRSPSADEDGFVGLFGPNEDFNPMVASPSADMDETFDKPSALFVQEANLHSHGMSDHLNEIPSLLEQPLALGFYVSTVGTLNPLPHWMLQQQRSINVFKGTLHLNVSNAQLADDVLFGQKHDKKGSHPLDSTYTYVVLR